MDPRVKPEDDEVERYAQIAGVGWLLRSRRRHPCLLTAFCELVLEATAPWEEHAGLAGLAPIARASGLVRGKRHVQGGRKRVRDALYMAAPTAIRTGRWRQAYDHLQTLGKTPKAAIVAVARKRLVALNAAMREQRPVLNTPIS